MHVITLSLLLGIAPLAAGQGLAPRSLGDLVDHARPLILFAGPELAAQVRMLQGHAAELQERQVLVVAVGESRDFAGLDTDAITFPAAEQQRLRARFNIPDHHCALVLVGKDGQPKLRSDRLVTWPQIARLIDSMPMRQQEMRRQ